MTDVWPYPAIDPALNQIILCVGRKGSGKSHAAREHFRSWPGCDRLVIDVNGDADPGDDLDPQVLRGPLTQLPPRRDERLPDTFRWIADPRAETFYEDLDQAVGAALYPRDRKVLLWIDEAGEMFRANATGPNARTFLHQSRHFLASGILCCPRPKGIDPLAISQADRILIFDVPHPLDRARIAENIGIRPAKLDQVLDDTRKRGERWSTLYVAAENQLYRLPPFQST